MSDENNMNLSTEDTAEKAEDSVQETAENVAEKTEEAVQEIAENVTEKTEEAVQEENAAEDVEKAVKPVYASRAAMIKAAEAAAATQENAVENAVAATVENTAENTGKRKHIVDLIREVASSRSHNSGASLFR